MDERYQWFCTKCGAERQGLKDNACKGFDADDWVCPDCNVRPLADTTPSASYEQSKKEWQGLTDEEQQELHDKWQKRMDGWGSFYQAVEQALKEKNSG